MCRGGLIDVAAVVGIRVWFFVCFLSLKREVSLFVRGKRVEATAAPAGPAGPSPKSSLPAAATGRPVPPAASAARDAGTATAFSAA